MITYQIALRLKDAGFTQSIILGDYFYRSDGQLFLEDLSGNYKPHCLCPNTDKLIKALADTFYILEKRGDRFYCLKPNQFNHGETNFELSSGSSAQEALAMLYLYYHENNTRNNGME